MRRRRRAKSMRTWTLKSQTTQRQQLSRRLRLRHRWQQLDLPVANEACVEGSDRAAGRAPHKESANRDADRTRYHLLYVRRRRAARQEHALEGAGAVAHTEVGSAGADPHSCRLRSEQTRRIVAEGAQRRASSCSSTRSSALPARGQIRRAGQGLKEDRS